MKLATWVTLTRQACAGMTAALALLVVLPLSAAAQDREREAEQGIVTTVDPCVPIDVAHFHRLLEIELGTSIEAQRETTPQAGRTWVHLSCTSFGIELHLDDGITRKSMMRVLDITQIEPDSRTRLLALAVAEFVVASWVELQAVPRPAIPAAGPPPPPAAAAAAERTVEARTKTLPMASRPEPRGAWQLGLGLGVEGYPNPETLMPAVSLRLFQSLSGLFGMLLGADAALVRVRALLAGSPVGKIDVVTASALAALQLGGVLGRFDFYGGVGARFGILYLSATSSVTTLSDAQTTAPVASVAALGRAGYRFGDIRIGIELELGWITLPAEGVEKTNGQTVYELAGPRLASSVSASLLF